MKPSSPTERGSALFYIFLAIIAFTTLTFAVSQSSREGSNTIDRERSELLATQILDYTGMIRRAIQAMQVDGAALTDICFNTPRWGHNNYDHAACADVKNQVFSPNGGGAVWQDMSPDIFDVQFEALSPYGDWVFSGANAVHLVGSDCVTPGAAACNELLMVLPYIRQSICVALNRRLQVETTGTVPVDDANFNITTAFNGSFSDGQVLNAAVLHGKRSGCFQATTTPVNGSYAFFAVLAAR